MFQLGRENSVNHLAARGKGSTMADSLEKGTDKSGINWTI